MSGPLIMVMLAMALHGEFQRGVNSGEETITLGGGCFWCIEAVFQRIKGVRSVVPGYAGGTKPDPTYEEVCSGTTGHAEVARISYDPAIVSLSDILEVFWEAHDPTTRDRQGADVGTQYRSVILYHGEEQRKTAEKSKIEAQKRFSHPIVTEIVPLKKFYRAEDYHHDYFTRNPNAPYCRLVIIPKLQKLKLK